MIGPRLVKPRLIGARGPSGCQRQKSDTVRFSTVLRASWAVPRPGNGASNLATA